MQSLGISDLSKIAIKTEGPHCIGNGSSLTVELALEAFQIASPHKTLLWVGELANAAFVVTAPRRARKQPQIGTALVKISGVDAGRMDFVMHVGARTESVKEVPVTLRRHKKAFASYASEDRDEVIARVQGMQKAAPSLKVFLDVISLRSGQEWESELRRRIPAADVFYLFWCTHASNSRWVEMEWRCALDRKGAGFIDPIPLESPDVAPPPPELASKHFNDSFLAFLRKRHAGSSYHTRKL